MQQVRVLVSCVGVLALGLAARADFAEGFDVAPPPTWSSVNQSSPPVGIGWFQGNPSVFGAQSGAMDSYVGANFQSTAGTTGAETIDLWLITPVLTGIQNGDTISFFTRTPTSNPFPDRLELRLSTNSGVNTGGTPGAVGDFSTLLLSVDPDLMVGGYPETWTLFSATISGLGGPVNGAFAFRYFVTNAGPNGDNSDYIGIDEVVYHQVPAPAGAALLLGGLGLVSRRRRR